MHFLVIGTISVCLITIFVLFVSRRFSPIPYFPSNKRDLPLIIKALNLKNDQVIIDFGAGDGIVIFEVAREAYNRKLSTKFVAIEINPVLILMMQLRKLFHPNLKNIQIIRADMFKSIETLATGVEERGLPTARNEESTGGRITTRQASVANITIYLYISPWFLEKIYRKLKKDFKSFTLVSYFYPLPDKTLKPTKTLKGVHNIYLYKITR